MADSDSNAPATKGDLIALEERLTTARKAGLTALEERLTTARKAELTAFEERLTTARKAELSALEERLTETFRDMQTELLKAFYAIAETHHKRITDGER